MRHFYLLYHKRQHTAHIRIRDQIGQVVADSRRPPFRKGTGIGMRQVDWWHDHEHDDPIWSIDDIGEIPDA